MNRDRDASDPLGPFLRDGVARELDAFLDSQSAVTESIGATAMRDQARAFTSGGKRLRPAFCFWSHVAAGGSGDDAVLRAAASLDLLHVSALVHDDLIDGSDVRRGLPASHRQFAALHAERDGEGDARRFGDSAAILLGDLLVMWSVELFDASGLPADALDRARPHMAAMRTEVTCGQFLDLSAAARVAGARDIDGELDVARRVLEYKSASYSVRRPAQVGASLAGAPGDAVDALGRFGSLVGSAFQLRDDVLGVFGDPTVTGKPAGDDLREGKRTVLVLRALADADARDTVASVLGNAGADDEGITAARGAIEASGALAAVEDQIEVEVSQALEILDATDLTDEGRDALRRLTELSVRREH